MSKSSQQEQASPEPTGPNDHTDLFAQGLQIRREVVGDEYVDRALANGSSEFAYPLQRLITEHAWATIWSRPGLSRPQRSLLNMGMLIALRAWPELAVHVRGAVRNGLSEIEIREAVLQASVYCGAPAGIEAMRTAERVLGEMEEAGEYKRVLGGKDPAAEGMV